jgi:hypothetical protein
LQAHSRQLAKVGIIINHQDSAGHGSGADSLTGTGVFPEPPANQRGRFGAAWLRSRRGTSAWRGFSMFETLLGRLARGLELRGIPYMLVGDRPCCSTENPG